MNPDQKTFLLQAAAAARKAGHIYPDMASCEAALESTYGKSVLAIQDKNLFGTKQHRHAIYGTHVLPTREFENGEWITTSAAWVSYPDWASCFADRMATLSRLASAFPHYRAALAAVDPRTYVTEVSQSWSTDPGWRCSCGVVFISEASAKQHAAPDADHHTISLVPGLGRALKILAIYDACEWDPPVEAITT